MWRNRHSAVRANDTPEGGFATALTALRRVEKQNLASPSGAGRMILPHYKSYYATSSLILHLSSNVRGELKIHDEAFTFFRNHLRVKRKQAWIQRFCGRAIEALQANLEELKRLGLVSLEAQCNDDDWIRKTLRLTVYFFWVGEEAGWRWLVPRYIESVVFNEHLRESLLQIADDWQSSLSSIGKKRLALMRAAWSLSLPLFRYPR